MRTVNTGTQLALPVTLADYAVFDNFHAAGNEPAVEALRALDREGTRALWLWGPRDVGKSHLLQAVCAGREDRVYVPGAALRAAPAEALAGFERYACVCIDDVDRVLGGRDHETALFHLYNRLIDAGGTMLVASGTPPAAATFALPDLASRLRGGLVFALQPLTDAGRLAALTLRAQRRGIELPEETGRYLLNHYRRDMRSLCELLDTLDLAALAAARRRLTVPFVRKILQRDADGDAR